MNVWMSDGEWAFWVAGGPNMGTSVPTVSNSSSVMSDQWVISWSSVSDIMIIRETASSHEMSPWDRWPLVSLWPRILLIIPVAYQESEWLAEERWKVVYSAQSVRVYRVFTRHGPWPVLVLPVHTLTIPCSVSADTLLRCLQSCQRLCRLTWLQHLLQCSHFTGPSHEHLNSVYLLCDSLQKFITWVWTHCAPQWSLFVQMGVYFELKLQKNNLKTCLFDNLSKILCNFVRNSFFKKGFWIWFVIDIVGFWTSNSLFNSLFEF